MARSRGRLVKALMVAGPVSLAIVALIASRDPWLAIATALIVAWVLAVGSISRRALEASRRRARRLEERIIRSRRRLKALDARAEGLHGEVKLLVRRLQEADTRSTELLSAVREVAGSVGSVETIVRALQDAGQAQAEVVRALQETGHARAEDLRGDVALLSGRVDEVFHQAECLAALYRVLDPPAPLPPTRIWAMSPDVLRHLAMHVLEQRPRTIVECGSGTSTAVMALALQRSGTGGRVVALEHLDWARDATVRLLEQWGVAEHAEVRLAPLETYEFAGDTFQWYARSSLPEGPFDLVVVDGPPSSINPLSRYPAGEMLIRHLTPEGRALLDDHARPDERKTARRWLSEIEGLTSRKVRAEKGALELFWDTAT